MNMTFHFRLPEYCQYSTHLSESRTSQRSIGNGINRKTSSFDIPSCTLFQALEEKPLGVIVNKPHGSSINMNIKVSSTTVENKHNATYKQTRFI